MDYKIWITHNKLNGQHHLPGLGVGSGSRFLVTGKEEKTAECVTVVRDTSIISNITYIYFILKSDNFMWKNYCIW